MSQESGFFSSLFDFSFTEFVTTRIIKLLFILSIIGSALMALMIVISGFSSGSGATGIFSLLLAPVAFILFVISSRIWLELIIVVFRISENTGRLVEQTKPD